MEVDLANESRRGRAARAELALVREHLDAERERLFDRFCDPRNEEEVYYIKEEARAISRLENFLDELVTTGELAEKTNEGETR